MNDRIKPGHPLKPSHASVPAPKPRVGVARFSDLSGPMNPTGVFSAQFLMLLQSLKNGSDPESVATALQHYMDSRAPMGKTGADVSRIVASSETPDEAVRKLITAIRTGKAGGAFPEEVPAEVRDALVKAVHHIMDRHIDRLETEIRSKTDDVASLRRRFAAESAGRIVDSLLG